MTPTPWIVNEKKFWPVPSHPWHVSSYFWPFLGVIWSIFPVKNRFSHIFPAPGGSPYQSLFLRHEIEKRLRAVYKAIESMNHWTSQVMTSWVEYHIHRLLLPTIIPIKIARPEAPVPLSQKHDVHENWWHFVIRSQLKGGLDRRGLQEASTDDLCQALALWDIKQGQELRGVLSTLLLHYILLEVFFWCSDYLVLHRDSKLIT